MKASFAIFTSIIITSFITSCSTYKPPDPYEKEQQNYFKNLNSKKVSAEIDYGTSSISFYNVRYNGSLPKEYAVNLKLYPTDWERYTTTQEENILSFYSFYFPFSFTKSHILNQIIDSADKKVDVYGLSTGFAFRDGYSYKTGDQSRLDLYNSNGILLGFQGDFENDSMLNPISTEFQNFKENMYGGRLNDIFESGIRYRFNPQFALNLNYESNIIYPKVIFPRWLLERTVETVIHFGFDFYITEIFKQSPNLIPVINFVFNSALSYGFHVLRTRNMNWTKETQPAFLMDHITFGLTILIMRNDK